MALSRKNIAIIVGALAIGLAVVVASGAFNSGKKIPDVRLIEFSPEGKQTIKQGEQITVNFKVRNNELSDASNVRVDTTFVGNQQYFVIDKPIIELGTVPGPEGESSKQSVIIRATNALDQTAVETRFNVTLYVGAEQTDLRQFDVRVEK